MGLRVLIDPWGNGKYFGGEQVSKFLQDNVENRQVSALTGEKLPYACFNTNSYRDYFRNFCVTLARETNPDGFSGMSRITPSRKASPPSPAAWRMTGPVTVRSAANGSRIITAIPCRAI